jgi:hypothetical protein
MVQRKYLGISDPRAAFDALRPLDNAVTQLMTRVKPMSADYLILSAVRRALGTAAYHFTREPDFYSAKPPG